MAQEGKKSPVLVRLESVTSRYFAPKASSAVSSSKKLVEKDSDDSSVGRISIPGDSPILSRQRKLKLMDTIDLSLEAARTPSPPMNGKSSPRLASPLSPAIKQPIGNMDNDESESNAVKYDAVNGEKAVPAFQWLNKELAMQAEIEKRKRKVNNKRWKGHKFAGLNNLSESSSDSDDRPAKRSKKKIIDDEESEDEVPVSKSQPIQANRHDLKSQLYGLNERRELRRISSDAGITEKPRRRIIILDDSTEEETESRSSSPKIPKKRRESGTSIRSELETETTEKKPKSSGKDEVIELSDSGSENGSEDEPVQLSSDEEEGKRHNKKLRNQNKENNGKVKFGFSVEEKTKKIQKSSLIQENIVDFFNNASEDVLKKIPRCKPVTATKLIAIRPFLNYDDMEQRFEEEDIPFVILEHQQKICNAQFAFDRLLQRCQTLSGRLRESIEAVVGQDSIKAVVGQTHSELSSESSKVVVGQKSVEAVVGQDRGRLSQQPALLNEELQLKPYQLIALNWLIFLHESEMHGILADEMGLGKTIEIISFLAYLLSIGQTGPHLIIVPASTIDNWMSELARWCPALEYAAYYGNQAEREEIRSNFYRGEYENVNVFVTSYSVVSSAKEDVKFFKKSLKCDYVIFDEAHMLKNCTTRRYRSLIRVNAKRRILLTGTPLQNNLLELMSLMYFLMPDLFDNNQCDINVILQLFATQNRSKSVLDDYEASKIEQAKQIIRPFVLRRLKADVLEELPSKTELVKKCEMSERQRNLYRSFVKDYQQKIDSGDASTQAVKTRMFHDLRKIL